jgi:hypothetical protein
MPSPYVIFEYLLLEMSLVLHINNDASEETHLALNI